MKVSCSELTLLLLLVAGVSCSQLSQGITNLAMDMAGIVGRQAHCDSNSKNCTN